MKPSVIKINRLIPLAIQFLAKILSHGKPSVGIC